MNITGPSSRKDTARIRLPAFALLRRVGLMMVLLVLGCVSLSPDLVDSGAIAIEGIDSRTVRVGDVQARVIDNRLTVSGYLEKHFTTRWRGKGYLYIKFLGENGAVLGQAAVPYHRTEPRSRWLHFSETFAVRPDDVRIIRVTHCVGAQPIDSQALSQGLCSD